MAPRKKKVESYSKFFETFAGELLEIITNLRVIETNEDPENGISTIDKPMVLEGLLLDECESYYYFGLPEVGITNVLVKTQVVHVSIIREETEQYTLLKKTPVDKSELN